METSTPPRIGFAGLGAMGFGMATHLIKSGHKVTGYDVYPPTLERFTAQGGIAASTPRDCAKGNNYFIVMVANAAQAEEVLFHPQNSAVQALPRAATVIICSTVPAAYLKEVQRKLDDVGRPDIFLVDSPVSGGTVRAANGSLTILTSASATALSRARPVLMELSEKLYEVPGGIGAASNVKMINQLLAGIHIAAAAEAMGLAATMGLDTRRCYEIIVNAAGNSWMFENRVPHMLANDWTPHSALDIFVKDMGIVTSSARAHNFPLPLSSTAEQLYITAKAHGYGREDDAGIVRIYTPGKPAAVHEQAKPQAATPELPSPPSNYEVKKVGFIGLGAMGLGMASSLVKAGFSVSGYDVWAPSIEKFVGKGGHAAKSPAEAAENAQVLVIMVQNASQAESVLFGAHGAIQSLPDRSVIILNSTVPPSFVSALGERLAALGRAIDLVDAPVSGGVARAATGALTIITSGSQAALSKAAPILHAMSGPPKNLYPVSDVPGAASSVKLINQLLAGVHIVAAAEALAFAAKLGLDTQAIYDIIRNAAGGSWMFENRVPAMLTADWTPHSALAIFVKDLGIVIDEAKRLGYATPLSAAAHQVYITGASHGWTNEADGGVVRVWENHMSPMGGITVASQAKQPPTPAESHFRPREYDNLPAQETLASLPPVYGTDVIPLIREAISHPDTPVLVVLDDDPTGTQTVHDVHVLTVWDVPTLRAEFSFHSSGFFILTNSRALPDSSARLLIREICTNVAAAADAAGVRFEIVLRGDSTLRGHFPLEADVAEEVLGRHHGLVVAPFFLQGGRLTVADVHYVRESVEGKDVLVPASKTPFAKDAAFGFRSSNLRDYVLEKAGGRFKADDIVSIGLDVIREQGPEGVAISLLAAPEGGVIIVNAAAEEDMAVFAAGCLLASHKGKRRYLYRTAAAFVSARLGITAIPPLGPKDLGMNCGKDANGGLIVAGSYVPKTTAQLAALRKRRGKEVLHVIELDVEALLAPETAVGVVDAAIMETNEWLAAGKDVLAMTSRKLITSSDASASLAIGAAVASALVRLVQGVTVRPRYIIAKGGITSSDAATKGLGMRRARIVGQAAPGVPLWECEEETSRHRGVPYVVFPGNVGGEETLGEVVEGWGKNV